MLSIVNYIICFLLGAGVEVRAKRKEVQMICEPFPSAKNHRNDMRLQEIKVGWQVHGLRI